MWNWLVDMSDISDEEFMIACAQCNLSNEEIATICEVSKATIQKWRSGQSLPRLGVRKYIVRQLAMAEFEQISKLLKEYERKRCL